MCRAHQDGACWAFIAQKFDYLRYGSYPVAERWRVDVTEIVGAALIVWLLWPGAPRRDIGAGLFFVVFPILAFVLLRGWPSLGLPRVDTLLWGGVFVTAGHARWSASCSRCRSGFSWRWGDARICRWCGS